MPVLKRRSKWCEAAKPLKIDDLVLICDVELPRNKWFRGRVIKVYKGQDGQVRVADVKTTNGVLRRPATKLAILDVLGKSSG